MIKAAVIEHNKLVESFFNENAASLDNFADICAKVLGNGKKILLCGNGGSACDAMHIAGEFVGRFVKDRKSLPAIALTADGCALTAISNDYGYEQVFSRQVEGLGQEGDILIGLTTSGNSENVIKATETANAQGMFSATLSGREGGKIKGLADMDFIVRHPETARIQEVHIMCLHLLCGLIEEKMGLNT